MANEQPSPIQPDRVYADVAALIRWLNPSATAARIVVDGPGGRSVVAVPLAQPIDNVDRDEPDLTPMQAEVAEVLRGMKSGDVLSCAEIARKSGWSDTHKLRQFVQKVSEINGNLTLTTRGWKRT